MRWMPAALAGGVDPLLLAGERRTRTVSILHTTDLHGHIRPTGTYDGIGDVGGFARCASQIRAWRKASPHHLVVDCGDVYQGTPVGYATGGRVMIDLFNRLGYDAWVPGNHDFDWGAEALAEAVGRSRASVLCANLDLPKDQAFSGVAPWTVKEAGGFRIGLAGLTTPGLPAWLTPETLGGAVVRDPAPALARAVAEMRAAGRVDAVVVIGHMGWTDEDDHANRVRASLRAAGDVEVYLGGHSHRDRASWWVGDTLCSQANYFGIHCGRVDLTFDLETRRLLDRRAYSLYMDDRVPLDAGVMQVAAPDLAKSDEEQARVVAELEKSYTDEGGEDSLAKLFCRAFAWALQREGQEVEALYHGTFGRGALGPGKVTVADCWRVIPYENLLVTASFSPADLDRIAGENARQGSRRRLLWGVNKVRVGGQPCWKTDGGRVLADGDRVRVAVNSYDSQSGGRRLPSLKEAVFSEHAGRTMTKVDTRGALIGWLAACGG